MVLELLMCVVMFVSLGLCAHAAMTITRMCVCVPAAKFDKVHFIMRLCLWVAFMGNIILQYANIHRCGFDVEIR